MKKVMLFLGCVLSGALAWAVPQYDYGMISGINNEMNSSTAFVNRGGIGSVGLQNVMRFNQSAYIYASFSKNMPTSFGAYTMNGSAIKESFSFSQTADGKYTVVDSNNNPVQFKEGDVVGFWVTDANGKKVYNTPKVDGGNQANYTGTAILNKDEYVIGFGSYGDFIGSTDYDKMIGDSSHVMNIQIGSKAPPSGQPLPGVLAAVLIGGGAVGVRRFMKKRSAAKK